MRAWDEIGMMMGNNFMCLLLLMSLVRVRVWLACVMDVVDGDFLSDRRKMIVRANVCSVRTSSQYAAARCIAKMFTGIDPHQGVYDGRLEIDNHADTFVAGRNCALLHFTERVCDVMPYWHEYEAKKGVPIAKVATGYTSAHGKRSILVFNEALWMPELENSLVNPNQLRHHGIEVQDNPFHREPMIIQVDSNENGFVACLKSKGTDIYLDTWTPTDKDLNECPHFTLTAPEAWDPGTIEFPTVTEDEMREIEGSTISAVGIDVRRQGDLTFHDSEDHYHQSVRIFDINAFNRRIMKSDVSLSAQGPLSEEMLRPRKTFISSERHSNTTLEDLSEIWNISVEQAKMTLDATTQHHVRSAIMPLSRRYCVDRMFEPKRLLGDMASDTMDPRCYSIHGDYRYCQVFGNKMMFCEAIPIVSKSGDSADGALKEFLRDYGAPENMITDGLKEQTSKGSKFLATLRKNNVNPVVTMPHRPNHNPAEGVIRELRKRWYRGIFSTNCPRALWNYGLPHFAKLMQLTASNAAGLNGKTPLGVLLGETPDISQYLDFGWYNWVWYKENAGLDVPKIGRFLGVAKTSSNIMSFHILPESGIPVVAGTVQRVTEAEKQTDANKEKMKVFSEKIAQKFKEDRLVTVGRKPNLEEWADLLEDDEDFAAEFNCLYDNTDVAEADDDFDPDSYDAYLNMELTVNRGGPHAEFARVTKRLKDHRGNPIGTANSNPILDTRMYEVEYHDGSKQAMAANVIAENMFASVDEEGYRHKLLDTIIDIRKTDEAVKKEDSFVTTANGNKRRIETTKGWEVLVQWKDGTTTWSMMKDVKDSYPVQLAEYAVENKVDDKPAFKWWVPYTMKKKAHIISKIKSKYWVRSHKYGIKLPKSVKEAIEIDNENGNSLWFDALMKEMKNVRCAFEEHEGDKKDLVGYTKI